MQKLQPQQILFEDNHLLVVNKPSDVATMGAPAGQPTIARLAAEYLKRKYHKPGNVFVGVVSRLDRRVSGVLVLARTSKAASRLSQQIRERQMHKLYHAWVEGVLDSSTLQKAERWKADPDEQWLEIEHFVAKNERLKKMQVVPENVVGAQRAHLRLRVLTGWKNSSLLQIQLLTGRKHQIRVQLAELGHPILGDAKYGAQRGFQSGIGLHCSQLTFEHPTKRESMTFRCSPITAWQNVPETFRQKL